MSCSSKKNDSWAASCLHARESPLAHCVLTEIALPPPERQSVAAPTSLASLKPGEAGLGLGGHAQPTPLQSGRQQRPERSCFSVAEQYALGLLCVFAPFDPTRRHFLVVTHRLEWPRAAELLLEAWGVIRLLRESGELRADWPPLREYPPI